MKLATAEAARVLAFGIDSLVLALDVTWQDESTFAKLAELKAAAKAKEQDCTGIPAAPDVRSDLRGGDRQVRVHLLRGHVAGQCDRDDQLVHSQRPPGISRPTSVNVSSRMDTKLSISTSVMIRGGASRGWSPLTPTAPAPPGWAESYTLRRGDTLYSVSRKFRVPLDDLLRTNNITDPSSLKVGTRIEIPDLIVELRRRLAVIHAEEDHAI